LMIEAYKIILRESGSVRRAEDLARRMGKRGEGGRKHITSHVIDESIDQIRKDIEETLTAVDGKPGKTRIKLTRSRAETRLTISLYGNLEATEEKLQKVYKAVCNK